MLELHNEDDNDDGDENNSNSNSMYVVGSSSIIKGFYFFNSIYFVGPICVCVFVVTKCEIENDHLSFTTIFMQHWCC